MRFRASTLALAGVAPLVLAAALTLGVLTGYAADAQPSPLAEWRYASVWAMLAAGGIAMATVGWAWNSEADRATGRLSLGYAAAAAIGMVIFVYILSYAG